jgi:hypothetical protein
MLRSRSWATPFCRTLPRSRSPPGPAPIPDLNDISHVCSRTSANPRTERHQQRPFQTDPAERHRTQQQNQRRRTWHQSPARPQRHQTPEARFPLRRETMLMLPALPRRPQANCQQARPHPNDRQPRHRAQRRINLLRHHQTRKKQSRESQQENRSRMGQRRQRTERTAWRTALRDSTRYAATIESACSAPNANATIIPASTRPH